MKDPYLLATLRQRVDEQQARWQATAAPGQPMGWLAAEQMIDQGQPGGVCVGTVRQSTGKAQNHRK